MKFTLQLAALFGVAVLAFHWIDKAGDRQQRNLEKKCHCVCSRVEGDDAATFKAWANRTEPLTMAWGGGMWWCPSPPPRVKER